MEASKCSYLCCTRVAAQNSTRGEEGGDTLVTPKPSHLSEFEVKCALLQNLILKVDCELFESTRLLPRHARRQHWDQNQAALITSDILLLVRTAVVF